MSELTAAIIGYGRMARGHRRAFEALGVRLVGAADPSDEARAKFTEDTGCDATYAEHGALLEAVKPDLVAVVTWDALHAQPVIDAAAVGVRGIVCEKPMAMNLAEADAMLAACDAAGATLVINHQRHYDTQYATARELIEAGEIGEVRCIEAYLMPNCIHTDGTHTIQMTLDLLGRPKVSHLLAAIDGHSGATYFGHRSEDAGTAVMAFDSGQHAHLSWGSASLEPRRRLVPAGGYQYHQFWIHGETGTLELNGDNWQNPHPLLRLRRGAEVTDVPLPEREPAMTASLRDLLGCLETGAEHPLSGRHGRDVLEVIIGIYESARRRGVVRFPVEVADNPFLALCDGAAWPA